MAAAHQHLGQAGQTEDTYDYPDEFVIRFIWSGMEINEPPLVRSQRDLPWGNDASLRPKVRVGVSRIREQVHEAQRLGHAPAPREDGRPVLRGKQQASLAGIAAAIRELALTNL